MPAGSAPTKTLPIVVVEDIRLLRDGISAMLRSAGLRVVASIRSGEDAVLQILQARPRIVRSCAWSASWANRIGRNTWP